MNHGFTKSKKVSKKYDIVFLCLLIMPFPDQNTSDQYYSSRKRIQENTIPTGQHGELNKIFFATGTPEYKWTDGIRKVYKENDFNTTVASSISITNKDPLVMVVKKNVSILSSILIWLNKQGLETRDEEWNWNEAKWRNENIRNLLPKYPLSCDQPMLLIDDECDSASIDISKRSNKGPD